LSDREKTFSGNLILEKLYDDELFLKRITWNLRYVKLKEKPYYNRFMLYEVKNGQLVRPIDYYIKVKPLNLKYKHQFTFKVRESAKHKNKKYTELYYQSANGDLKEDKIGIVLLKNLGRDLPLKQEIHNGVYTLLGGYKKH
jgi:hypothetical protein